MKQYILLANLEQILLVTDMEFGALDSAVLITEV